MKTTQQSYPALAEVLNIPELYLKREDMHPYGSHKGRSIPLMIKEYRKQGVTRFAISSSGNAALAAAIAIQKHNANNPDALLFLHMFVGQRIAKEKYKHLLPYVDGAHIVLEKVERPKQMAFQMEKDGVAKNLRQSTDDLALVGYESLAEELAKIPNLKAVFIPTSSGTTAVAVAKYFKEQGLPIQVHIVQTTACHVLADLFQERIPSTDSSIAGAIVDKIAHRRQQVTDLIAGGWVATDDDILAAQTLLKEKADVEASTNSALSIVGAMKAKINGTVAAVLTGT